MGSADSKACSSSSKCDEPEDLVASVASSGGVRLHQVDDSNFLGRLQDAERFAQLGFWRRLLILLGKRTQLTPAAHSQGTPVNQLVEQQEQLAQMQPEICSACSTAAHSITGSQHHPHAANHRCSTEASASDAASTTRIIAEHSSEAQPLDLTTLLRQGFDPAAYEKRLKLARFAHPEKFGLDPREV